MLTLYHAPRSRSFRTLWLLEEIAAPYDIKPVSIRRGDGSGARDPANPHPHGKVPTIVHDGAAVFETPAIALYLTDAFPEAGLGPKIGEKDRAAYLTWLSYYTGVMEPALTAKFLKLQHIYGTFGWAPMDEVSDYVTRTLERGPYFLGDRFSAVDVVVGGSISFLMMSGMLPKTPIFETYATRITARPAYGTAQAKDSA